MISTFGVVHNTFYDTYLIEVHRCPSQTKETPQSRHLSDVSISTFGEMVQKPHCLFQSQVVLRQGEESLTLTLTTNFPGTATLHSLLTCSSGDVHELLGGFRNTQLSNTLTLGPQTSTPLVCRLDLQTLSSRQPMGKTNNLEMN